MDRRTALIVPLMAACLLTAGCGGRGEIAPEYTREAGIELYRSGDLIGALRHLRAAVRHNPADDLAYPYLADCYLEGGWQAEGREHFRELLSTVEEAGRDRQATALRYHLAALAAFTGDADRVAAELLKARALRPPTPREARPLAEALLMAGRVDAALGLLRDLAQRPAAAPEARVDLVRALWHAGRTRDALDELEALRQEHPENVDALALAALARYARGDLEGSRQLTRAWLSAQPRDPDALWNLTRIAVAAGDLDAADRLLSTVVATGG